MILILCIGETSRHLRLRIYLLRLITTAVGRKKFRLIVYAFNKCDRDPDHLRLEINRLNFHSRAKCL